VVSNPLRFGSLSAVLVAVVLAGCGSTPTGDGSRADGLGTPPTMTIEAPSEKTLQVSRARLGRGGSLHAILEELDVEDTLHLTIIEALESLVDSRRLPAEAGLAVARDSAGAVVSVSCRPAFDHFVRVTLGPEPHAERVDVPVQTRVETAGGVVETTVAEALSRQRDSATLTLLFADIFQWDVDLFVDPRPGDRVRLVYETRSLAPPAADLPAFGKSGMEEGSYLGVGRVLAASYDGLMASSAAYWVEDDGRGGDYYDTDGDPLRKAFLKSPLNYRRISSRFTSRRRHPITRRVVPHHGVDFVAASGTPVVAAADGRVISAGWDGALGKAVRLRHGNGYKTIYGHLRGFARGIRRGAQVEQNQVIGYVGSTGRATGSHLHYTMLYNDRAINPMTFDNPPVAPLDESYRPVLDRAWLTWAPVLQAIRTEESEVGIARAPAAPGDVGPG
jgi:murein DD-endopeptidase MepM/ murein hydrolase activator NlpD